MSGIRVAAAAALALSTAGCVGSALPPGTLVQPAPIAFAPPPPPPPVYGPGPYGPGAYYGPPPPRRCYVRPGPFGPERVCRRPYAY